MEQPLFICSIRRFLILTLGLSLGATSPAVTILSGPSFTPATNAPLAGTLSLTTDADSRVSVSVDDGTGAWMRNFYDFGTHHTVPLLGFKPGRTNLLNVTVYDKYRNSASAADPLTVITAPLPSDFPHSVLYTNQPDKMEPGYTLFRIANKNTKHGYLTVVDNAGEVVWYSGVPSTADVRQLDNGDLFIPLVTNFVEIDMLGNTINSWNVPTNLTINLHDGVPTPHGTILYLSDASQLETNFPTSATDPYAPRENSYVLYNKVVEISATNSALLNTWSPIDVLDPRRLTYLTFDINTPQGWDIQHANALIEDPSDDTIIVSLRDQNAVVKFYRSSGELKWILGPPANWGPEFQQYLLTPVGAPFEWQYGQHAPILTPQGTLLVYDDGNYRASPFDPPLADQNNYSRAVEYDINEQTMEVSQVWDYGRTNAEPLYTDRVGNADRLPQTGNVLVTFGYVVYVNGLRPSSMSPSASMVRIKEVTHDVNPEVLFDLAYFDFDNTAGTYQGYSGYRSHRIADLYAHPAKPVLDLAVSYNQGTAKLLFSADETRTYTVESSTDLASWQELGTASQDGQVGNYSFEDSGATEFDARYYRVVAQ